MDDELAEEEMPRRELARKQRMWEPPATGAFTWIREFAHQAPRGERRTDFAETLCWNPGVATGEDGVVELSFALNDSITTLMRALKFNPPPSAAALANRALPLT